MGEAATEILPGLLVLLALGKAAAVELRESGMVLEILAIVAAVGIPSAGVIFWRAGLNKLDDRYMDKDSFTKLKSEIGDEMAEVRTHLQTEMRKWEVIDEKVTTLISDERHRDAKLERMEGQLTALTAQSHKLEIDQLKGFSTLKDEIRVYLDSSMKQQLEEIRAMVDRKL
jgi:hypothetical protein